VPWPPAATRLGVPEGQRRAKPAAAVVLHAPALGPPALLFPGPRESWIPPSPLREFTGPPPNMSHMKAARDARSAAVVINAGSRRAAAHKLAVDMMRKAGVPISSVHHVLSGGELAATLDRVVADGHDLVVVGGGDGTVSYAAGRVAGTNVALGVLPLGTANDFARTLEIPNNLAEACATLAEGKVVDIDLGRANGEPFLNVASVGLSVAVTEALSPRLKRYIGPLAYGIATLRAYAGHKAFRARLEFPEGDHEPMELENLLQVPSAMAGITAAATRSLPRQGSTITLLTSTPSWQRRSGST
jgi:diacylglycerol kinase (ATP)